MMNAFCPVFLKTQTFACVRKEQATNWFMSRLVWFIIWAKLPSKMLLKNAAFRYWLRAISFCFYGRIIPARNFGFRIHSGFRFGFCGMYFSDALFFGTDFGRQLPNKRKLMSPNKPTAAGR